MKGTYLNDDFFSRLETLSLHLQKNLDGYFGGKHLIRKYGQTVEFADFRAYEPGDDIRRIDWNLYGRLGKFFLKLFTDERQMHVQIFLDCSASMGLYPDKAEYALGVAAALGFLAIRTTDKVSFHLIKEDHDENPFGLLVGKNNYFAALGALKNIRFDAEADLAAAISHASDTGENDGLSVIISDFFTENNWKKAVEYLLYKKRQVLLIRVLDREEIAPSYTGRLTLLDVESSDMADPRNLRVRITRPMLDAYDAALADITGEIKQFCLSRGVTFVSAHTGIPLEKMIFRELLGSDLVR